MFYCARCGAGTPDSCTCDKSKSNPTVWICYRNLKNGASHVISVHATLESAGEAEAAYKRLEPLETDQWNGIIYVCEREVLS